MTLGEALPKEQARVRALIATYRAPELGGAGALVASMIELSLQAADQAVISGDVISMLAALEDLRGYHE